MEKRWASFKLTLVLLYLGVLPLTPEIPLPVTFALLAIAVLATAPLLTRFICSLFQRHLIPVQAGVSLATTPEYWHLLRPVAPGSRGGVHSRAPSSLIAIHG